MGSPFSPQLLELDSRGVRSGPFVVRPRLTADGAYDTNIYDLETDVVADGLVSVRPTISLEPDLARHAVRLTLGATLKRYFEVPAENSDQWAIGLSGRADLPQSTSVEASASVARRVEARGTFGDPYRTDNPVAYRETIGTVRIARSGGVLGLSASLEGISYRYSDASLDGVFVDQSTRDLDQFSASVRAQYRRSPRLSFFITASGNRLNYLNDAGEDRGSQGYSFLAGTRVQITDLVDAEAAVGFGHQDFADPAQADFDGLDFRLAAKWTPIPYARITFSGGRSVERGPVDEISAVLSTEVRVTATVQLGTRVAAEADASLDNWDYRGSDRNDTRYSIEAGAAYALTPQVALYGRVGFRHQSSKGEDARNYSGILVRSGFRVIL